MLSLISSSDDKVVYQLEYTNEIGPFVGTVTMGIVPEYIFYSLEYKVNAIQYYRNKEGSKTESNSGSCYNNKITPLNMVINSVDQFKSDPHLKKLPAEHMDILIDEYSKMTKRFLSLHMDYQEIDEPSTKTSGDEPSTKTSGDEPSSKTPTDAKTPGDEPLEDEPLADVSMLKLSVEKNVQTGNSFTGLKVGLDKESIGIFAAQWAASEKDAASAEYVNDCVSEKRLPIKYRSELESLGIKFVDKFGKVTLPSNLSLKANRNKLYIVNNGEEVTGFKYTSSNVVGGAKWEKC